MIDDQTTYSNFGDHPTSNRLRMGESGSEVVNAVARRLGLAAKIVMWSV